VSAVRAAKLAGDPLLQQAKEALAGSPRRSAPWSHQAPQDCLSTEALTHYQQWRPLHTLFACHPTDTFCLGLSSLQSQTAPSAPLSCAGACIYNKILQSKAHSVNSSAITPLLCVSALDCTAQERTGASAQQQGCGCRAARVHGAR